MAKFQCLLFVLKRSYISYYIVCMTVPLMFQQNKDFLKSENISENLRWSNGIYINNNHIIKYDNSLNMTNSKNRKHIKDEKLVSQNNRQKMQT